MTPQSAQGQENGTSVLLNVTGKTDAQFASQLIAARCDPQRHKQGLRLRIVSGRQGWGEGCVMMCGGLTKKNRLNKLNMDKRLERWSLNRDVLDSV